MRSMMTAAALALVCATSPVGLQGQQPPAQEQRPVFRAGAHFVRVDVYPSRDGQPIVGLQAADFELLEDGKPQTIELVEFIDSPEWTPNANRRDPSSQRAGMELARDPKYRVFVLYLDAFHVSFDGSHRTRRPIIDFLNRMIGPLDLFGVLTPAQRPDDLLLGQLTQTIDQQLMAHPQWGIADRNEPQPGELEIEMVYGAALAKYIIALKRLDKVYSDLEGLVVKLGDLRDERKNIVFFSDSLASPRSGFSQTAIDPSGGTGAPPRIGVSSEGKLTTGARAGEVDKRAVDAERVRLTSIDFDQRFRDLLRSARQANVSFYTVRPGGLDMSYSLLAEGISNLRVLADETDGSAVMGSNDIGTGLRKVATDLSSHYVLGYYTANTRWNGGTRRITVKLKASGEKLRARREYRAPTEAEMTAIREARTSSAAAPAPPSPGDSALDALARLRPAAVFNAYGVAAAADIAIVAEIAAAEIEGGRWKQGADVQVMLTGGKGESRSARGRIEPGGRGTLIKVPVGADPGPWDAMVRVTGEGQAPQMDSVVISRRPGTLLGEPIGFRASGRAATPFSPLAAFQLRRTERVRVDWPALAAIDKQEARLLDRKSQPLPLPVAVTVREDGASRIISAEANLAPLSIGEYLIELTAQSGTTIERKVVAIRVSMAR